MTPCCDQHHYSCALGEDGPPLRCCPDCPYTPAVSADDRDWQDAMIQEQAALITQRDQARKDAEGWKDVAAEWERAFHNERREADRPCACCARNHAPVP